MPELSSFNPALVRLRQGRLALGLIVRITRNPEVVAIAKSSGHDFLFVDFQNGPFSCEFVSDICVAGHAAGLPCFVRVASVDAPDVERLLNLGASGIIFADVRSAEAARTAVARCRFGPEGTRGVTGSFPHFAYRSLPLAEAKQWLDADTLVAVMIESPEALGRLADIAAVPGIDVIHLGANDLLSMLGHPGAFDGPVMARVTQQLIETCRECGKVAGVGGDKALDRQREYIRKGARFITTHSDLGYLMSAATERCTSLRSANAGD